MSILEKEKEVREEFARFNDWMDKYNHLIELGKTLPDLDEELRQDKYLISGCQARVWLVPRLNEAGQLVFAADSDALITKGIVALLVRVLSGQPPADILQAKLAFIDEIGLREHLSQTRSNGLLNMIKQIKLYALAFSAKQKP